MIVIGKAWKFGDDVNTDEIIPARHLSLTNPHDLAKHLMEDANPNFFSKVSPGDILVAGKNFGCGSSREHAPVAIKAAGIACVIAGGFARIFFRNAFNTGLLILESQPASDGISEGHEVEVDPERGLITNRTTGNIFRVASIPPFMTQLLVAGGLMAYISEKGKNPQ